MRIDRGDEYEHTSHVIQVKIEVCDHYVLHSANHFCRFHLNRMQKTRRESKPFTAIPHVAHVAHGQLLNHYPSYTPGH